MQKKISVIVDQVLPGLQLLLTSGETTVRFPFETKTMILTIDEGDILTIEGGGFSGIATKIASMGENFAGYATNVENADHDNLFFGTLTQGGKAYKNVSVFELTNELNSIKSDENGNYSLRLTGEQPFGIGYQGITESCLQLMITTQNHGGKVDVLFDDTNTIGHNW